VVNAANAVGTTRSGRITGLRPGVTNVRWRQRNASGWSRWTPTWAMSLATGTDVAKYKAIRNQFTVPGTASGTLTRVADPALHYNPYPGNMMPYYEPVMGGSDLAQIETLYAGMGYWTGGTGALSAAYQWQRSADNRAWSNISGATAKSYDRGAADIGNYVRCVVTVNGTAFNTAPALFPAAQTAAFGSNVLIRTRFDAMLPYEWPRVARTYGNASEVHLPNFVPAGSPDQKGGLWASKTGTNPWMNLLVTSDLQAGTYAYKVVVSFGQHAAKGNSSARSASGNHVLNVWKNSSGGTVWVSRTIPVATAAQPAAYEFAGQFSVSAGDAGSALNVRLQNLANVGGIAGGSPGLLYLEITKVA
jgi:hypothetical protein